MTFSLIDTGGFVADPKQDDELAVVTRGLIKQVRLAIEDRDSLKQERIKFDKAAIALFCRKLA